MKSTACGLSYDYPGDENLVKLKDCTTDARTHLASFDIFSAKKIQVLVSFRFLTSITHTLERRFFHEKKKNERKKETSITAILTIKNMKSVYLRA